MDSSFGIVIITDRMGNIFSRYTKKFPTQVCRANRILRSGSNQVSSFPLHILTYYSHL